MGVGVNVGVKVEVADGAGVLDAVLMGAFVDVATTGTQLEKKMISMDIAKKAFVMTGEFLLHDFSI